MSRGSGRRGPRPLLGPIVTVKFASGKKITFQGIDDPTLVKLLENLTAGLASEAPSPGDDVTGDPVANGEAEQPPVRVFASVEAFIASEVEFVALPSAWISARDLWARYELFAAQRGVWPAGRHAFRTAVRAAGLRDMRWRPSGARKNAKNQPLQQRGWRGGVLRPLSGGVSDGQQQLFVLPSAAQEAVSG